MSRFRRHHEPNVALDLLRWWCHLDADFATTDLSSAFVFDSGIELNTREEFIQMRNDSGGFKDVDIRETWVHDGRAAVLFEATDVITGLRHRLSWFMFFSAQLVEKVVECCGAVDLAGGRPTLARR